MTVSILINELDNCFVVKSVHVGHVHFLLFGSVSERLHEKTLSLSCFAIIILGQLMWSETKNLKF